MRVFEENALFFSDISDAMPILCRQMNQESERLATYRYWPGDALVRLLCFWIDSFKKALFRCLQSVSHVLAFSTSAMAPTTLCSALPVMEDIAGKVKKAFIVPRRNAERSEIMLILTRVSIRTSVTFGRRCRK